MEADIDKTQDERNLLLRIVEYCKYLYEEEKDRQSIIHNVVKVYMSFLTATFAAIAFVLFKTNVVNLFKADFASSKFILLGAIIFILSILFIVISFFLTIRILKVWRYERLCNPKIFALRSSVMGNEIEVLREIIYHYAVASNRNHKINDEKSDLLSYAFYFLIPGLFLFIISIFIFMTFLKGGAIK